MSWRMEIFATATFPETIYIGLNQTFWIVDNVRITLLSDHHWSNGKLFCQADFAAKPNNPTHLHLQQSFSYPDPNIVHLLALRLLFPLACPPPPLLRLLVLASLRLTCLRPAFLSTAMDTFQKHNPKQASHTKSTIEKVKEWDEDDLLKWIHQERPGLLKADNLEKFKAAFIHKNIFVDHAGDVGFFENKCKLPIGISESLAKLAREVAGGETAGMAQKGKSADHAHYVNCKLTTSQETDSRPMSSI